MPNEGDIGARLVSGNLGLDFVWRGDRFEHAVRSDHDGLHASQASDYESPVYQEVHQQDELVFASGNSGHCHWSASFQPDGNGFVADVACRVLKPSQKAIGIVYQSGAALSVVPCDESDLVDTDEAAQLLVPKRVSSETPPYTVRCRYRIDGGATR